MQNKGTWFDRCRISKKVMCRFIANWVSGKRTQNYTSSNFNMSSATVVDWSNYLREVCVHAVTSRSRKLGVPGKTVEIDEAKIGHRKYNRGRIVEGNWVFGIIERESRECFMVPVKKRDSDTLLPIIRDHILPGTTVISDCWRAYNCLQSEGFHHLTKPQYAFCGP